MLSTKVQALHVAHVVKALSKRPVLWARREGPEVSDPRDLARLLRLGNARQTESAPTNQGDEPSSVHHSISWSALPSTDCGMVRPSALYSSEKFPDPETEGRRARKAQGHTEWPGAC